MRVYAKVEKGVVVWSSDRTRQMFLQAAEGQDLVIEVDDDPSSEMRRFFEGAVVPCFFYLHPEAGWTDFKECREAIKLEFLPAWTKSKKGERITYARSTGDLSKTKFREFLDKVVQYLEVNYSEILDPEEYKRWRDSAPGPGEIYPQHARLKAKWLAAKNAI